MNILFLVLEDFPGSETRVRRQVRELDSRGHEVKVLCARGYSKEDNWSGARIIRTFVRRKKNGSILRRLVEYVLFFLESTVRVLQISIHQRVDLIQVANMPDFLAIAALPARLLHNCSVVLDMHDLMPELLGSKVGRESKWKSILYLQERAGIEVSDVILTVNATCVRILQSRHPKAKIHMIPNSPDTNTFTITRPQAERAAGPIRIGYHGTIAKRFGVSSLMLAVDNLTQEGMFVKLEIWGDGQDLAAIKSLADELTCRETIIFHGQTPTERLVEMLSGLDIGVVPYEEDPYMAIAYSTKAFELAALGIPMVLADLPGLKEQFSREAATYFRAGDSTDLARAIRSVMSDPVLTRAKVTRAESELSKYSWSEFAKVYGDLIEDTVHAR